MSESAIVQRHFDRCRYVPAMPIMEHPLASIVRRTGFGLLLLFAAPLAVAQDEPVPPSEAEGPVAPDDTVESLGVLRPGRGSPDPFTFLPDLGLEPLTVVQTRPIELTGFDGPLLLTVEGGIDLIVVQNDRAFRRRRSLVMPGDVIALSARSPLDYGAVEEIVLTVGTYGTTWTIATHPQDRIPLAFAFPDAVGEAPGIRVVSPARPLLGFEGSIEAVLAGPGDPLLRINGGEWRQAAAVSPGDRIELSATAPGAGERIEILLTIGSIEVPWTVATVAGPLEAEAPGGG